MDKVKNFLGFELYYIILFYLFIWLLGLSCSTQDL